MGSLLVRNAQVLATFDDERREVAGGGLFAVDGWIREVGTSDQLPDTADEVFDASHSLVIPGLVNTHHHLYQTLTRAVPEAQDAELFTWLKTLYPIWAKLTPNHVRLSTMVGLAELALTGCTTALDHQYLWPNGSKLDHQVEAAAEVGVRLHASRGSMSLGESEGGLPPDEVVESEEVILADTVRVIEQFHDPEPGAMVNVVVAPCSPFSVTPEGMSDAAELARTYQVGLHTHLAETRDEEDFCLQRFGKRPVEYAEDLGWEGGDVWFAHAIYVDDAEIERMARSGTGVAHCPTSNMRIASGIAPVQKYLGAGVNIGLGVDGSASNDASSMIGEARQAMLLARLAAAERGGEKLAARTALEMATRGGAAILGRDDIGSLEVGKVADFAIIRLDRLEFAGAMHDPLGALLLCTPSRVDHLYVQGRAIVRDGELVTIDEERLVRLHNEAARRLVMGS